MGDFDAKTKDIENLVKELDTFTKRALPFAARNSLNTSVFRGRKIWVKEIERSFTTRNKFTTRAVRVVKATGSRIESMEAILGSIARYQDKQERGGISKGTRTNKPIPTSTAAGQGKGASPRTRAVRRPNWHSAIRLQKGRSKGRSRKQRNAIAISQAVKSGRKFALIERDRGNGIVRVTGRKRLTVRLIWDLSRRSVKLKPEPTLQRSLDKLEPELADIHIDALKDQLKRVKALGF